MADVVLEQVGKTYENGVEALRDVHLQVKDGELLAVVGPSGSGKTTLLRLIAGLETPTHGILRIGGRIVNSLAPYRRNVAVVFQRPALYSHLSVYDNIAFALKLRSQGWRSWLTWDNGAQEIRPRVLEIAKQLELSDVLDRRPASLSGGQQQRVALGRALARRPSVYLLDEPLSNLDAPLRLEMRRELHLLHRRLRATIIHVSHDQDEAMSLGDRVAVLDRGVIRQIGRPQELYDRPDDRFVAGFLGWPPMNLLDGELSEVEDRLQFGNRDVSLIFSSRPEWRSFVGRPLSLGIRPEHVGLVEGPGESRLKMQVRMVERLGSIQLATLDRRDANSTGWYVTARLPVTPVVEEGATVFAFFVLTRAHLFDPATGRALSHGCVEGMKAEG